MKHKAIMTLYPNVVNINEENGIIEALDVDGNEVSIDMTAVNTKATELQTASDNEKQSKEDLKASAKAKLMAGEALTEEEANVMIGG